MREIGTNIFSFDEYLTAEQCESVVEKTHDIKWAKARTGIQICHTFNGFCPEACIMLRDAFLFTVNQMLDEYRKHDEGNQIPQVEKHFIRQMILMHYGPGAFFMPHIDTALISDRQISCIMYLNDDYDGGGLHYPRHDVSHAPKRGDIVFHPSIFTHPHRAEKVTRGTKYACVIFAGLTPVGMQNEHLTTPPECGQD